MEPVLLEVRGRAAARDELEAELVEAARELVEAGLVVDGDQRAHTTQLPHDVRQQPVLDGLDRSRSVSPCRLVPATSLGAITAPVSMPSST